MIELFNFKNGIYNNKLKMKMRCVINMKDILIINVAITDTQGYLLVCQIYKKSYMKCKIF